MSQRKNVARATLGGLLVGGAVGFAMGILLAPDEGREMRQRVSYLLDRWSKGVADFVDDLGSEGMSSSEARQSAAAVVADAKEKAQELLSEAEAIMNEARSKRSGASMRRAS
ncbi:MAG: YtxH domain-containing protein [Rubricoccaceae bacterium]|nr:YtxH domain-containing protein [Rubricoccaceae bacterium]